MLYISHTDLIEAIFKMLSVPMDLRVGLWRHLAEACEHPMGQTNTTTAPPPSNVPNTSSRAAATTAAPPFRRQILVPDFLTPCQRVHAQRQLTRLVKFETRRAEDLLKAFGGELAGSGTGKGVVKEVKVSRQCHLLGDLVNAIDQLKAIPNFHVSDATHVAVILRNSIPTTTNLNRHAHTLTFGL